MDKKLNIIFATESRLPTHGWPTDTFKSVILWCFIGLYKPRIRCNLLETNEVG